MKKDFKEKLQEKFKELLQYAVSFFVFGFLAVTGWHAEDMYNETLEMKYAMIQAVTQQIFPHMLVWIMLTILVYFIWMLREEIQKKLRLNQWVFRGMICLFFVLLIGYFIGTPPDYLASYTINGRSQSFAEILIRQTKDILEKEYEIIEFDSFEYVSQSAQYKVRRDTYKAEYHYLEINQGKYTLPLPRWDDRHIYRILSVPMDKHVIKVYKNTKFIVEVDGFKVNKLRAQQKEIKEYAEKETRELEIIQKKSWCTLSVDEQCRILPTIHNDDLVLEAATLGFYDPSGEQTLGASIGFRTYTLEKGIAETAGKGFQVYLTDLHGDRISNIIEYDMVKGKVVNIRYLP